MDLVIGGTGFIGANLIRRLLDQGRDVTVLVRHGSRCSRLEDIAVRIRWYYSELESLNATLKAVTEIKPQRIFSLAQYGGYPWQRDLQQMVGTNMVVTQNLLVAACRTGVEAFVHAGSSSEYGPKDHAPKESEPCAPRSRYGYTKLSATRQVSRVAKARRLPAVALRVYSAYGPWEHPDRLMPRLISEAQAGRLPSLANPRTARDFVWVGDVCRAFEFAAADAADNIGAVFNVGTGRMTRLAELVNLVRRLYGVDAEPEWGSLPDREWDTDVWVADPALAEERLRWKAQVDLEAGVRMMGEWLAAQRDAKARRTAFAIPSPSSPARASM